MVLDLSDNQLVELPKLPKSVLSLDISQNRLSTLSVWPPKLMEVDISANFLSSLPAFPKTLKNVDVSNNALFDLPEVPAGLKVLLANNNQLTRFPPSIMTLDRSCTVDFCGNPISQQLCDQLLAMVASGDYHGPHIYFSVFAPMSEPSQSFEDAVSRWYNEAQRSTIDNLWQQFSHVSGANDFSRFLDKLRDSINFIEPEFKRDICLWLDKLLTDKELRALVFAISQEGAGSCEDRATLTLNAMKSAEFNLNVERGYYDDRLGELLTSARAMFRLEQLEKIARDKAATLPLVDEIEIYLAYQIKLREPLALPIPVQKMRFFACSSLTDEDLSRALLQVQESEQKDFLNYLSTDWAPAQAVMKRLCPEMYQALQEKISSELDETFETKQQAFLVAQGLIDNEYHRMQTAPLVLKQIAYAINGDYLKIFLQQQGLTLSPT
jgi:Leucine-rich repeat (LRR) protein